MVKVRLRVSRVTQSESQGLGAVVEVSDDEARELIDAGHAELLGPLPVVEPETEPKTLTPVTDGDAWGGPEQAGDSTPSPDRSAMPEDARKSSWQKPGR